ncbi:hypothetical protein CWI38_0713p0020 [Hamiltosporidium tvaerminnensis]|uniref:Uncharacterized protein n=1 Tax=Hamiltosporidium tvaerminnensis TaxID=1176355 RepID=A0A4Q9LXV3_9MICR|nr:hypothetical protein CWI38_0713p0020 [Hamiltosporidium tvaerminnensis]
MNKWVNNFLMISQIHPDDSDYEKFYSDILIFLQNNNSNHIEYLKIFTTGVETFHNKTLISMCYRLINSLNKECFESQVFISISLLQKHIKSRILRSHVFTYIFNTNLLENFKKQIIKFLYDPVEEFNGLPLVLQHKYFEKEIDNFLSLNDITIYSKQVFISIKMGVFHNLDLFIYHFGNENNILAFKTYELFYFYIKKATTDTFQNFSIKDNKYICFTKPIKVSSIENFVFHFFDFIEENEILQKFYIQNDYESIKQILKKYLILDKEFKLEQRMNKCFYKKKEFYNYENINDINHNIESDLDYDYLFDRNTYKQKMDCIEL